MFRKFISFTVFLFMFVFSSLSYSQDKIYYTISSTPTYTVNSANIDGSSPQVIVADDGTQSPKAIALDLTNNKVYYTDTGHHSLRKCNMDGSNVTDVMTGIDIFYFALDSDAGKIYYTLASNPNYTVNVVNTDGSNLQVVKADDGVQSPKDILVDIVNSKLIYVDTGHNSIRKCNLDGSSVSDLISVTPNSIAATTANPPLPVELNSFTAASTSSAAGEVKVVLNWQTATEVNNYGFEIYRSPVSGGLWEKIGFVEGAGNSNSPKEYSYTDESTVKGTVQYRLKQIDSDGQFKYSETVEVNVSALPSKFELLQNYPNPFNPATVIRYTIPSVAAPSTVEGQQQVILKVYDILGNEVVTLVNENQAAGNYKVEFNGSNLASGIYIYKLSSGNFTDSKKLILMK